MLEAFLAFSNRFFAMLIIQFHLKWHQLYIYAVLCIILEIHFQSAELCIPFFRANWQNANVKTHIFISLFITFLLAYFQFNLMRGKIICKNNNNWLWNQISASTYEILANSFNCLLIGVFVRW